MATCKPTANVVGFPDLHLESVEAQPSLCLDNVEADMPLLGRYACFLTGNIEDALGVAITTMGEYPLGGV